MSQYAALQAHTSEPCPKSLALQGRPPAAGGEGQAEVCHRPSPATKELLRPPAHPFCPAPPLGTQPGHSPATGGAACSSRSQPRTLAHPGHMAPPLPWDSDRCDQRALGLGAGRWMSASGSSAPSLAQHSPSLLPHWQRAAPTGLSPMGVSSHTAAQSMRSPARGAAPSMCRPLPGILALPAAHAGSSRCVGSLPSSPSSLPSHSASSPRCVTLSCAVPQQDRGASTC